jgi:putative Mn2+ efflux pump MntP
MQKGIGIGKYVIRFALAYFGLLIGLGVLAVILDIESGAGATIVVLMGAAMVAVSKFIQDHRRVPTKEEKRKLVWFSYLASWLVSLLMFGIFIALDEQGREMMRVVTESGAPLFIGIIAFLALFYVGTLYVAYGYMANKQLEALQRKGRA